MKMSRAWAMPSPETFSIKPIADLLDRYIKRGDVVVDPFARNSKRGTITNDLDPSTTALFHLHAEEFCRVLRTDGVVADVVLFDAPYSPRQVTEVYAGIGKTATMQDTQTAVLYKEVRNGLSVVLKTGGIAVSFGWNSAGFGKERGYDMLEILLVAHGGAHNDSICVVERKTQTTLEIGDEKD